MKKFLTAIVVALAAPLALFAGEMTVSGTGSVSLAADNAYVTLSVVTEAAKPAEALKMNSDATNRVFDSLTRLGIKKNEMQTQGLRLTPKYFYAEKQEPKLIGYTAVHSIQITVCKIADTGTILDTVVKDGANRIENLSFGLSEEKKKDALNLARKQAAQSAIEKAELYCNAFGLKTKELKTMTEYTDSPTRKGYAYERAAQADSRPTNIEGGEIEVKVTVSTVWDTK
jgi:hypothetical protein